MNALFSRLKGSLALAVLFVLFSSSVVGQVWINGTDRGRNVSNTGYINSATVGGDWNSYGHLNNYGNARIETVNVTDEGGVSNYGNARIETANVADRGWLNNYGNARIETANVTDEGWLENWRGGTIGTANVSSGILYNYYDTARIETANVSGGKLWNEYNAHIGAANISGGVLENRSGTIGTANVSGGVLENQSGTIGTANVSGGVLENMYNITINSVTMTGGIINNNGRIGELTYTGGIYSYRSNGAIGTLNYNVGGNMDTNTDSMLQMFGGTSRVGMANVNVYDRGQFYNYWWNTLNTATVNGNGTLFSSGGTINNAAVSGNGTLFSSDGTINNAAVDGFGWLYNDGSTINNATINGFGTLRNDSGAINNATVSGYGTLRNYYGAINNATVNGFGTLYNDYWGRIAQVTVNGGEFYNRNSNYHYNYSWDEDLERWVESRDAAIGTVFLNSGFVGNIGFIDNLTYNGGIYNGRQSKDEWGYLQSGEGRIGTLNVTGNSTGIDWGRVETVNVYDGGRMANVNNNYEARIETANIYDGGSLSNNARIVTANVYGGFLDNLDYLATMFLNGGMVNNGGTIEGWETKATMTGGTLNNSGSIGNLTYYNGTYNNWQMRRDDPWNNTISYGSINTLNIAGNSTGIDWGYVGTVNVYDSGKMTNANSNHNYIGTANIYDGGDLTNNNTIYTANLLGGTLNNRDTAVIGTVNASGGWLYNHGNAIIDTATVNGGILFNYGNATVKNLTINSGLTDNLNTAKIVEATINGGKLWNSPNSQVANLTIYGGYVENAGIVENFTMNGGTVENYNDGARNTIVNTTIYDGTLLNGWTGYTPRNATFDNPDRWSGYDGGWGGGHIESLTMNGGTVENTGRIDGIIYVGGIYNGQIEDRWGDVRTGTIGTLTLAGNSANNTGDWGTVEHLQFDPNGGGLLTISAFTNDIPIAPAMMGFQAASFDWSPVTFNSAIQAQSIDFTYGNVALDMSNFVYGDDLAASFLNAFGFDGGFNLASLLGDMFGTDNISGVTALNSFEVAFGDLNSFWLIDNGYFATGWSFDSVTGFITFGDGGNVVTPEPATLAILGLGLAGLGWARRQQQKHLAA